MSSINQAKAEAQKLIKEYNKLQAEARTATSVDDAARKTAAAEKLIVQISELQSAITKFQSPKQTVPSPKIQSQAPLEERVDRLTQAQKKTRTQIEQLSNAKSQLTLLLKQEKDKNIENASQTKDKKLQQELEQLIEKKEAEQSSLKQKLDNVQQESKKETDIIKLQRDTARAVMDRQIQLENENSLQESSVGMLRGIAIGTVFSIIIGVLGVFLYTFITEEDMVSVTQPKIYPIDTSAIVKVTPVIKVPVASSFKALGEYRDKLKNGGKGPWMVKLPEGTFKMGSKNTLPHHNERPQHEISLESFSIGKYEVTFEEYDHFSRMTNRPLPNDNGFGRKKRPVINVNWHEAVEYTKWLSKQTAHKYRLPSEREWEYAAGAGAETVFWWGFHIGENNANCASCGSEWIGQQTAPVGSFPANPFGISDTIGNVMEWTLNCYHGSYKGAPSTGNIWEGGNCTWRTVRSSSYRSNKDNIRTTIRKQFRPSIRMDTLGFRVMRVY